MSIYRTAVNKPVTTALIFIVFVILGGYALMNLALDNFPKIESNTIMVMCSYQGASAEDIENNVTKTLENSLNSVANLKSLTSTSKENLALLSLEFEYGIDIDVATNDVRDKLDMVSSYLPEKVSTPIIFKFSADDLPIMILSARATQSAKALEKILDDKVATPLARISGVGTVSLSGAPQRELQVYCDPQKLEAYGLTVTAISSILAQENRNTPSGSIDIGSDTYTLRVEKEFKSAEEMLGVVVGHYNGRTVYLRDVARVQDDLEERGQEAYCDGVRGAIIVIQKQSGANTVNVIRGVKKALKRIEKTLPSDVKVSITIDNSRNILNTLRSLEETILITFLVVMLVVFLFLGRWRATLIIVSAIPISLLASLLYLFATGETLNIISMSALSIAIGMVVDDAIVVLENVTTHIERGEKPKEAAVHGTQEVGISVIASTLTMLAVFLPLTMITGMSGVLFRQLGWIVSIIMIVSTTGALTLVPMMCSQMLKKDLTHGAFYKAVFGKVNSGLDAVSRGYGRMIAWCVNHRTVVVLLALAIFIGTAVVLGPAIKTEYFPKSDSGRLRVSVELPIGTGQNVTRDLGAELYRRFCEAVPEIRSCNYSLGQASTDNAWASMQTTGTYKVSYNIDLGSKMDRQRSSGELADVVRGIIREYPSIKKFQVTEGMGGMGGNTQVELEIYGYDFATTDRVAAQLAEGLRECKMCSEVIVSRDEYTPEYSVDFDRTKLSINGLNSTSAASYLSACINGSVMTYFREDGDEYEIRVRLAPEFRTSIEDIENITIYNSAGKGIRVKDLGMVVETRTPPQIIRKDRERMVMVTGVAAKGAVLSEIVEKAQEVIDRTDIPAEVSVVVAGDYEDQQDAFRDLLTLLALIVILVYIVMAAQFESLMSPFVIMFSIPFALTGVLIGSIVTDTAISVMGMIGIIILMGIVVKNGIVLIDYTILCRERGMSIIDSVVTASRSRLRPILMTTLTTVLGMIPMAIGHGEGAEMWNGLGITVCWGLSISTLITLVLIPVIYTSFSTWQEKAKNKKAARAAAKA
ncbi:MAG: efflux RND transporter permease subunit [Bacteroidales bacterium]|nr:efflux RND transporter permease subunit [Bacteroidales bacterium]